MGKTACQTFRFCFSLMTWAKSILNIIFFKMAGAPAKRFAP